MKHPTAKLLLAVGLWLLLFASYAVGTSGEARVACGVWAAIETIAYVGFSEPSRSTCPFCKRRIPTSSAYCAKCVDALS